MEVRKAGCHSCSWPGCRNAKLPCLPARARAASPSSCVHSHLVGASTPLPEQQPCPTVWWDPIRLRRSTGDPNQHSPPGAATLLRVPLFSGGFAWAPPQHKGEQVPALTPDAGRLGAQASGIDKGSVKHAH